MSENPRRVSQARNFTTNVPKILDLKSSSEQKFFRKLSLGAPDSDSVTPSNNVHYRDGPYVCVSQQITEIFLFELRVDATLSSSVTNS